ncbi:MAG: cupin domain-containing protein [Paracoccaceae bacterium]|nr:cupin domain-containing protein [Paracoccaceae bacterium]
MGKILINNVGGTEWQAHSEERVRDGANPNLSWQFLIDASKHQNESLSMGILRLPVEESLPLHHHDEQEIYYIIKGKGEILMSGSELKPIAEGDSIYIPNSIVHGLKIQATHI